MTIILKYVCSIVIICTPLLSCQQIDYRSANKFRVGAEVLVEDHLNLLFDKKIGLVVNHTSLLSNGKHILDTLLSFGLNISALFSPEHGIYGSIERGKSISDSKLASIPIYSLHGNLKKPTNEMMSNIDILIYDIQDLGVRFYTYISTLYFVLEAAVENDVPMIVLDRPVPNSTKVSGPILNSYFKSFLGLTNIPVVYGMTSGELAELYLKEFISNSNSTYDLKIIPMNNWHREMKWEETGLNWILPSPNIPDLETALVYPGTCFLEGTNISEGRGTEKPFRQIGAPFVSSRELINEISKFDDGTFKVNQISFIPKSIKGKAENPKYENTICNGILIKVELEESFDAVKFGVILIYALHKLYPGQFKFDKNHFDLLAGTDQLRKSIMENQSPDLIINAWNEDLDKFKSIRKKYLIY